MSGKCSHQPQADRISNELVTQNKGMVAVVGNCIRRVYRDGQEEKVIAYFLVAESGDELVIIKIPQNSPSDCWKLITYINNSPDVVGDRESVYLKAEHPYEYKTPGVKKMFKRGSD